LIWLPIVSPAQVNRWISIGPTRITSGDGPNHNSVGRVTSIAINPQSSQTIFVGARGSGVWKTTDGGASWNPVTDTLPTLTVSGLAIAPSNPQRLYLATPVGIFRSDDGGATWPRVNSTLTNVLALDGAAMIVHPTNPNLVFTNTCGDNATGGVQRSDDGGATWRVVLAGNCGTGLTMDAANSQNMQAALTSPGNSRSGIYESRDGGATWTPRTGCPGAALPAPGQSAVHLARSAGTIFASFRAGANWSIFRTNGQTCTVNGHPDYSWDAGSVASTNDGPFLWSYIQADPANPKFVYATGTNFWVSTDSGASFSQPSPQPHVDHHAFATDPANPAILFIGSDGGIYKSTNRGQSGSWSFLGEGLATTEFYDIADSAKDPKTIIGGTQDNGTSRFDGSSTVWKYIVGGDSEIVDISESDPKRLYEIGQAIHQIETSSDGGSSWHGIGTGMPPDCLPWNGEFPATPVLQFHIHPDGRLLAACKGSLWRGLPWATIFTPTNDSVSSITVDPQTDIYLAGTNGGKVFAGPGGASFTELMTSVSASRSTDIEFDRGDPSVVFVTFLGSGAGRVYRLKRVSANPPRYTSADITANLPAGVTVKTIGVDRLLPQSIFVGTDQGVFRGRSSNQGATWTWAAYNNGIPAMADVRALEVHPTTGVMRAGTFGRGAYQVNTDNPLGSVLQASGHLSLLRVHEQGSKYGPPDDQIDADVVIQLDTMPEYAFGFTLRTDTNEAAHQGMLDRLRDAFRKNRPVVIDYERTGFRNNRLIRVMN
jgi:photosystem II stability/assembly factor-like uncharacterized protein